MRARTVTAAAVLLATAAVPPLAHAAGGGSGPLGAARDAEPIVMTGAQIPAWAAPPAEGVGDPAPGPVTGSLRSAHNGTLVVPPTPPTVTPVDPAQVAAYAWTQTGWHQIRVQIDQRFPYFLVNGRSSFGIYSGTDEELTYAWGNPATDAHDTGEESWKRMFGSCDAQWATDVQQVKDAGYVTPGQGETAADYLSSMQDPQPLFDADDELSFMAGDAGGQAPAGTPLPAGTSNGQTVTIADPLDPGATHYVYLFTQPGGSSFTAADGYVHMARTADSLAWHDRYSYAPDDPNKIGTSNTGYGPNLPGTVCETAANNDANPQITTPDGQPRPSTDRTPHDSFVVKTPNYKLRTDGRWLIRHYQVRQPDGTGWSKNIVARWKGRAFQQSPDSSVSLVGFEDEQVNWEQNSALLGWRVGPVRAIREVWGADSGTNVTKTEYYYRDADAFAYHLRVHPIPPDGLYTDWDYRPGVATRYYNLRQPGGVPIDGVPDSGVGEIDQIPVTGQNAEVNTCDPTYDVCSAMNRPEEVAGNGFGLVYQFELTGPTAAAGNVAAVPYYRDDACFDDGTGDAPAPRPWPGEASTDPRVQAGYVSYWQHFWQTHPKWQSFPEPAQYSDLKCQPKLSVDGSPFKNSAVPPWQIMPFQGAIAEHGIHFFFTQDSDNTFLPKNTDEVDGQQWRFAVPMKDPANVLIPYSADVSAKLVAIGTPLGSPLG